MKLSFKHLRAVGLLALGLALPSTVIADHHETRSDPTGTWTWTRTGRNGNEVTTTLQLKADGEKVTGKISGWNNNETGISNGQIQGNQITFDVVRSFNGNDFTMKYAAKMEGNTLQGTSTFTGRDGQTRDREWTATRSASLAGDWGYTVERNNGDTMDVAITFKVEGEQVTGMVRVNEFEVPLEGTFKDGTVSYTTQVERNGNSWTSHFEGKVEGDVLTGKSTTQWNDQERTREVVAKRTKK